MAIYRPEDRSTTDPVAIVAIRYADWLAQHPEAVFAHFPISQGPSIRNRAIYWVEKALRGRYGTPANPPIEVGGRMARDALDRIKARGIKTLEVPLDDYVGKVASE